MESSTSSNFWTPSNLSCFDLDLLPLGMVDCTTIVVKHFLLSVLLPVIMLESTHLAGRSTVSPAEAQPFCEIS
jgi:hypothetical protein